MTSITILITRLLPEHYHTRKRIGMKGRNAEGASWAGRSADGSSGPHANRELDRGDGRPGGAAAAAPADGRSVVDGRQNIDDAHYQAAEYLLSSADVGQLAPRWMLTKAGAVSAIPTSITTI